MKVTVLIPCYNAEPYLGEALESALSQGVDLHEVIVLDDGSTDGSCEVARSFGHSVTCRRQANAGISQARNAALELASGDFIAFLDADDVWPEGSLLCRFDALRADESMEYVYGVVEQFVSPGIPDELSRIHTANLTAPAPVRLAGAMLIRRRLFERIGGFDPALKVGETVDWVARADAIGAACRRLPELVLRRRLHATNTGLRQRNSRSDYLAVARAALQRRKGEADG